MSHTDDNLKISELLTALLEAIRHHQTDDVLALLRVLRMNGLKDDVSAELIASFTDRPQHSDFELAQRWAQDHLASLPTPTHNQENALDFDLIDIPADSDDFDELDAFLSIVDEEDLLINDAQHIFEDLGDDLLSFADDLGEDFPLGDDFAALEDSFADLMEEPTRENSASTFDEPPTMVISSSLLTGDARELTRQFDPAQLQALSEISQSYESSTPEPTQRESVHQEPTRSQFPLTEEVLFDFESAFDESNDGSDELDFDFGPSMGAPADDGLDEDDDFDFDFGPSTGPADLHDDHFDFDFSPSTGVAPEQIDSGSDPFAAEMGYVDPEDDFFFPPPLNATPPPTTEQQAPSNTPVPPQQLPQEEPPTRSSTAPGLFGAATKQGQHVSLFQRPSFASPEFSQEVTPPRGNTPLPAQLLAAETEEYAPGAEHTRLLNEDELLALGEELTLSGNTAPRLLSATDPPSDPLDAQHRYRGEPLLRGIGDEPTPAKELEALSLSFAIDEPEGAPSQTNPFAHQAPTGVRNEPLKPSQSASFHLEEVHPGPSQVTSTAAGMEASLTRARSLYERAEFQEALGLVEALLELNKDFEPALELKAQLEGELKRVQKNRIGSLTRTPTLAIGMDKIATLDLDHRAGFLLSQIDGLLTFEDILDMSAMSRLETLTLLAELLEKRVITAD